LLLKAT